MNGPGPLRQIGVGFLVLLGAVALVAGALNLSHKPAREGRGQAAPAGSARSPTSAAGPQAAAPTTPSAGGPATNPQQATAPSTTAPPATGPSVTAPQASAPPATGPSAVVPPASSTRPSNPPGALTPVPPLTDTPAPTPVQQQYDTALAAGLASSPGMKMAEAVPMPKPAFGPALQPLAQANTPQQWVQEFVPALLGIDFAHQSRPSFEAWVSAEAAPELLPGVPAAVQDKVLYLSLFDTSTLGGSTPIPDQATWEADGRLGVRWRVSGLEVQTDPQYSKLVAAGWEPVDQRFVVEDVSGLLETTGGGPASTRHFSMAVYVGSARWHGGYGTVLVNDWKET